MRATLGAYTIAIALLSATAACGGQKRGEIYVDPEVRPYLNEFITEATNRNVPISTFGFSATIKDDEAFNKDLDHKSFSVVGLCRLTVDHKIGLITFRKSYWDVTTFEERRLLVFHEAGHCLLGIQYHIEKTLSIMNPYLPAELVFEMHKADMIQELFTLPAGSVAP